MPGSDTQATTNGFGVVFTDVDSAGSARLDLIGQNGEQLGQFAAPAAAGDGSLSFLGVSYGAGERIARARITSGAGLDLPDVTQGGPSDVVALDDFIYGEPKALAPPAASAEPPADAEPPAVTDAEPPAVKVKGLAKKIKRKRFLRSLRFTLEPSEPSSFEVALLARARGGAVARASRVGELILASKSLARKAGTRTLRLRPSRRLVGKAQRFKVVLRITAFDAAGNRTVVKRSIRVRPR